MSNQIFYGKTHLRRNTHAPAIVAKFRTIADLIKRNGEEKIVKSNGISSVKKYTFKGVTLTIDQYYGDKTTTIENVGRIHLGMNSSESYFDINFPALNKIEASLNTEHARLQAA